MTSYQIHFIHLGHEIGSVIHADATELENIALWQQNMSVRYPLFNRSMIEISMNGIRYAFDKSLGTFYPMVGEFM